ncbi:MAG: SCO family protein [Burkholderiaceae bacterium]|nr:SCO family protein [Burkholderiaceae bacterium]
MDRRNRWIALLLALLGGWVQAAGKAPTENRSSIDPAVMQIDESRHLGQQLAPGTQLLDEQGEALSLGDLLGKPVILVLSYYGCDGACPTINQNLAQALQPLRRFQAGRDFRVLTVSFDRQDGVQQTADFVQRLRQQRQVALPEGWRFAVLRDPDPEAPQRFAQSVGFRFFWSRIDQVFLHPNVLVFLTPEGRVARYIYGTRMDTRTLELALIDADWGRISNSAGAVFDMLTGACFSYNFSEGRYQPNYALFAGLGALAFGLGAIGLGLLGYRRRHARRPAHAH